MRVVIVQHQHEAPNGTLAIQHQNLVAVKRLHGRKRPLHKGFSVHNVRQFDTLPMRLTAARGYGVTVFLWGYPA